MAITGIQRWHSFVCDGRSTVTDTRKLLRARIQIELAQHGHLCAGKVVPGVGRWAVETPIWKHLSDPETAAEEGPGSLSGAQAFACKPSN